MTKWIVSVLAALALLAPAAQANTLIIAPEGSNIPYQRWIDESAVPTPAGTLTLEEAPCPVDLEALACISPEDGKAWINLPAIESSALLMPPRWTFLHEAGHFFAATVLRDGDRERFRALRGGTERPWDGEDGLEEVFADSYMSCALNRPRLFRDLEAGYSARICRLIRRAYGRATS